MTSLALVCVVAAALVIFAWVASLLTGDTSWVDRSWSVAPVAYAWIFAGGAHLRNARLDVVAVLITLWGVRLTYNFARRGGYRGVEDYRWAVLRARMSRRTFQLFNFFFIALYQNVLLVLITLPMWVMEEHREHRFTLIDGGLAVLFLAFTVGETRADHQQWTFQEWKRREIESGIEPTSRFATQGLFRLSRHPNYFFEVAQWWVVAVSGVVASRSLNASTWIGAVLLTLLFVGSTRFTESLTIEKYPEYANYQHSTPAVIPFTKWRRGG